MSSSISNGINQINGVKNTFSSWDSCMSKSYCKWPVIIGIIIGCLFIFSLLWCLFRCLCCGMECCCGCLSCFNACCPSPRGGRSKDNQGYQQAPPTPYQYQQPPPPMYPSHDTGYRGAGVAARNVPQTATFDASRSKTAKYNEDSLPAMPSWDNATSRRVEEPHEEADVEMDKLSPSHTQQEVGLLTGAAKTEQKQSQNRYDYSAREEAGDLGVGGMHAHGGQHASPYQDYNASAPQLQRSPQQQRFPASPYQDYNASSPQLQRSPQQQRFPASPYGAPIPRKAPPGPYSSTGQDSRRVLDSYSTTGLQHNPYPGIISPVAASHYGAAASPYGSSAAPYGSSVDHFADAGRQQQPQTYPRAYEPSTAAPSYHSRDVPSPVSPPGQQPQQQQYQAFRAPAEQAQPQQAQYPGQPTWRDV